jgi:hypothetical protein
MFRFMCWMLCSVVSPMLTACGAGRRAIRAGAPSRSLQRVQVHGSARGWVEVNNQNDMATYVALSHCAGVCATVTL